MARCKERHFVEKDDYKFDSRCEYLIYCWIDEMFHLGYIDEFIVKPKSFVLLGKNDMFRQCTYTPDFAFKLHNDSIIDDIINIMVEHRGLTKKAEISRLNTLIKKKLSIGVDGWCYIDAKGGFGRQDTTFSVVRKWVYALYGVVVAKADVKPKDNKSWFGLLGTPEEAYVTEKGRPSIVFNSYPKVKDVFKPII